MNLRRALGLCITSVLFAAPGAAVAQQPGKVARVGWVILGAKAEASPRPAALVGIRAGLQERGWVEGKNIVIDVRAGDRADAPVIAKECISSKTDVIFADGAMVNGLKAHSGLIPIVFTMSGDPLEAKWVQTLARPGGNVTGMSSLQLELEAKRLELLKELRPGTKRVALFGNNRHPGYAAQHAAASEAAARLGLTLLSTPVQTAGDFQAAFAAMTDGRADAILVFSDSLVNDPANAKAIADYAARRRIVATSAWPSFAEAGNVLTYGPNEREFFQRAAAYIDKILRGANPADIPVEFPARLELTINQKSASAAGLKIPSSLLLRADRVIR